MQILLFIFFIFNLLIFLKSTKKSKKEFYSDTFLLSPLGIYVWGDALVLAPFWMVSSFLFIFIGHENILKYILIFYIARSFYEVFYWLNHQAVKSDYNPPFFRKIKWMKPNESAILYQLMHTCVVVLGIFLFAII
jgi:hypothetical protein